MCLCISVVCVCVYAHYRCDCVCGLCIYTLYGMSIYEGNFICICLYESLTVSWDFGVGVCLYPCEYLGWSSRLLKGSVGDSFSTRGPDTLVFI